LPGILSGSAQNLRGTWDNRVTIAQSIHSLRNETAFFYGGMLIA
jgi:hypothetical protein